MSRALESWGGGSHQKPGWLDLGTGADRASFGELLVRIAVRAGRGTGEGREGGLKVNLATGILQGAYRELLLPGNWGKFLYQELGQKCLTG